MSKTLLSFVDNESCVPTIIVTSSSIRTGSDVVDAVVMAERRADPDWDLHDEEILVDYFQKGERTSTFVLDHKMHDCDAGEVHIKLAGIIYHTSNRTDEDGYVQ